MNRSPRPACVDATARYRQRTALQKYYVRPLPIDYGTALSYRKAMMPRPVLHRPDPAETLRTAAEAEGVAAYHSLGQQALRTDVSGMPLEWIDYREAARLYYTGQVAYSSGSTLYQIRGGTNARSGLPSLLEVHSIIATTGQFARAGALRGNYLPPLNNETLFRRDGYLCMYCGMRFHSAQLSRDHVRPFFLGGLDCWNNVVTACRRCNNAKAARTPEQAGMQLLAVPFTPTYAEYIYLKGRRVLADQMEYLIAHFPRSSPLHRRIKDWLN